MPHHAAIWTAVQERLAGSEPTAAVLQADAAVEVLLTEIAERFDLPVRVGVIPIAYELQRRGLIPEAGFRTIEQLRSLSHLVAHGHTVGEAQLPQYLDTVRIAINRLDSLLRTPAAA